jgi:hypothetical protein
MTTTCSVCGTAVETGCPHLSANGLAPTDLLLRLESVRGIFPPFPPADRVAMTVSSESRHKRRQLRAWQKSRLRRLHWVEKHGWITQRQVARIKQLQRSIYG